MAKFKISLIAALIPLMYAQCSFASTTTSGTAFPVSLTVNSACTINSGPTAVTFAASNLTAPADQTSSVSITCTSTTPYNVYFTSANTVTSNTTRELLNGTNSISYQILNTSSSNTPIGNTAATGISATGTGAAAVTNLGFHVSSYGTPVPGTYTDTVTLNVTY
jgi:spore coat protein U-like protein